MKGTKKMVKIADELKRALNGEISNREIYETLKYGTKEIKEEITCQSRWTTYYEYIVKDDDNRYWQFEEACGSTECQDDEEFDIYTIKEVEPYEKVIIDYRPVDANNKSIKK